MAGRLMLALTGDTALLPEDREMLADPAVGGVILFSRNFASSRALRQLTADIRRQAGRPLLIAADHEGGRVQRFRGDAFTVVPPLRQLAAADNADSLLYAAGVVLAAELLAHGVDIAFAPVLDLDYGASAIIGDRAAAAAPEAVARLTAKVIAGLAAAGMPACGKHFPGHGFVAADSHTELPRDERSYAELQAADLLPFQQFSAAGGPLLMTAHVVYSAVDDKPATFSSRWLNDILREHIGYQGLVVSDDLGMAGAAAMGAISVRLQAAAAAGCDLLLSCQPQDNAAVLAAALSISGGAAWQQLLDYNTDRITVGDARYCAAGRLLAAL